jgi:CheY-like chemotaxis protein
MNTTTLLLIDDDADDREFFEIALTATQLSIEFLTAENGSEAIRLLHEKDESPDIIFLDLNMPLMSGKECLSYIRSVEKHSSIPVVIFSTSSYDRDIEECEGLGATHFLTKTHDIDHLSILISKILNKEIDTFTVL